MCACLCVPVPLIWVHRCVAPPVVSTCNSSWYGSSPGLCLQLYVSVQPQLPASGGPAPPCPRLQPWPPHRGPGHPDLSPAGVTAGASQQCAQCLYPGAEPGEVTGVNTEVIGVICRSRLSQMSFVHECTKKLLLISKTQFSVKLRTLKN